MRNRSFPFIAALVFMGAAACAEDDPSTSADWHPILGGAKPSTPLTGAIFTTTSDGTHVNHNIYEHFCDVYLNGGPKHPGAAGLPVGDYFFQVTNPSGRILLSSDAITARQFHVDSTGRISGLSGAGDHDTGNNLVDGGVTVQLCPFAPTPNPGCEFKVWVTRIEDYDASLDSDMGARNGFLPSRSKTDNFKVCQEEGGGPDGGGGGAPDAGMGEEE